MPQHLSIDRFEGDSKEIAVLISDGGLTLNVPRAFLPKGVKAGDVLSVSFQKDAEETHRISEETHKVQKDLEKTDTGEDLKI
jgi:hypothetical protein